MQWLQIKKRVVLNFSRLLVFCNAVTLGWHISINCQKRFSKLIIYLVLNYELLDILLQNIYIHWKYLLKFWRLADFFLDIKVLENLPLWNLDFIKNSSVSFYLHSICYFCFSVSTFSNLLCKCDVGYKFWSFSILNFSKHSFSKIYMINDFKFFRILRRHLQNFCNMAFSIYQSFVTLV